jgi:hypothetical protein
MNSIIERISKVKSALESKYGKFILFCAVELEDFEGRWDIVASASWFPSSEFQALSLLIDHIRDNLSKEECLKILRVVTLSPEEPFVKEVLALEGDRFNNRVITGLSIKTLHILSKQQTQQDGILEELYRLGLTDEYINRLLEDEDINRLLEESFPIEEVDENQVYKSNVISFPIPTSSTKEKENVKRRQTR